MPENLLTVAQVADRLKIHRSRIIRLIGSKKLPARKLGSMWVIVEKDVELVRDRKPGYPKGRKRK